MENRKTKKIIYVHKSNKNALKKRDTATSDRRVIERMRASIEEEGLKNFEISELANWPTSKTSKILTGAQQPRLEDIQELSYALGADPEVFLAEKMNIAEYNKGRLIQTLAQVVNGIQQPTMAKDMSELFRRDVPYVMCKTAGLKVTRFVKRGNLNEVIDVSSDKSINMPEAYIYDRKCKFDDATIPVVGYWVSSDNKYLVLALCMVERNGIAEKLENNQIRREQYKEILNVAEAENQKFVSFMKENGKGFPQRLQKGEITSVIYSLQGEIPDNSIFEQDFRNMISLYAKLIEEVTGKSPNFGIDINRYNTKQFDIGKVIEAVEKSAGVSYFEVAKKNAEYRCFLDEGQGNHETFKGEDGAPYVEAHLIVPLEAAPDFGENIFREENVVCLCPLCSAKIKNACNDIRSDMVWSIFQKRKEKLRSAGIEVTPGRVFELWNIK